ncbi:MAG: dephospho-CoA kinase, partial [Acutalibacteraceae bacterium]
ESGFDKMCDLIVSVTADDELLRSRISRRDNINECRADDRLACQLDNDFFVKHSDYIINNNGTTDELEAEVAKAIRFCIDRLRAMKNAEEK